MQRGSSALAALLPLLLMGSACTTGASFPMGDASSTPPGPTFVAAPLPATGPTEGRPTPGMPILVPDSPLMLVPFAMERERRLLERTSYGVSFGTTTGYLGPSRFEFFKYAPQGTHWHNVLLGDRESGATRLLLERRGLVLSLAIAPSAQKREGDRASEELPPRPPPFLLFRVVQQDTDGDAELTEKDATVLYLCDGRGGDLHQITPDGTQTWSWQFDDRHGALHLMVAGDSDGDGKFTTKDETRLMRLDLRRGGEAVAEPLGTEAFTRATELLR